MENIFTNFTSITVPTIVLILVLIVSFLKLFGFLDKSNLPPGPFGYPIVGHLPLLGPMPHEKFIDWAKQYGPIFRLKLGSWPTVVINDLENAKMALMDNADIFSGRPPLISAHVMVDYKGFNFSRPDARWRLHQRIANKALQMFVDTKDDVLASLLHTEASTLVEQFLTEGEAAFDPREMVQTALVNITYQICFGKGKNIEDNAAFKRAVTEVNRKVNEHQAAGNMVDMIPFLKPFFKRKIEDFSKTMSELHNIRRSRVKEHYETFIKDDVRDVIDGLIVGINETPEEIKRSTDITDEQIFSTLFDFLAASADDPAISTQWALMELAQYPDIQLRVQKEIDDVLGQTRLPNFAFRSKMPLMDALVLEVLRFVPSSPVSMHHYTTKSCELEKLYIPEETLVIFNLHAFAHDEKIWGDPQNFRPERFLDKTGKVDPKLRESFLPFSGGKRRCPGEQLANMMLFTFLTTILQRCKILKGNEDYTFKGEMSMVHEPKPFTIRVVPR